MVDGHFTHHGKAGFSYILAITYILSTVLSFAKDSLGRYFYDLLTYFGSFDIKTSF